MKKRLMILALMCALLVSMMPVTQARAEETKVIPVGTYRWNDTLVGWDWISEYEKWYISCIKYTEVDVNEIRLLEVDTDNKGISQRAYSGVVNGHERPDGLSMSNVYSSDAWCVRSGLCYYYDECKQRTFVTTVELEVEEKFYNWFVANVEDVDGVLGLEIVTDGFPRFFDVVASYAMMYKTADTSSTMVAAFSKGGGGVAYGVEYDAAGNAMYKVVASIGSTIYEGYMLASAVAVGYSLPTVDADATPAPTITPTPTAVPSGGSSGTGIDDTWYLIEYVVDGETYSGYVLGNWFEDVSGGLTTVVADKVQVFRGRYVTATPQHYLSKGDQVNIKGKYDSVVSDGDFEENINVLVHAVEAVPVLISSVFSFLPDWCLMLVGVVVSVAIVLKLIF